MKSKNTCTLHCRGFQSITPSPNDGHICQNTQAAHALLCVQNVLSQASQRKMHLAAARTHTLQALASECHADCLVCASRADSQAPPVSQSASAIIFVRKIDRNAHC